jgi:ABC-type multidrug transport system fused ATPase/permease subunit
MHVTLDDIGLSFSGKSFLFRHINASLHCGQVYALTGPSGSGK